MLSFVLAIMAICLVAMPIVSAGWDWDNGKSYNIELQTATIKDACLFDVCVGGANAEFTLTTSHVNDVLPGNDTRVAEWDVNLLEDDTNIFDGMEFYDLNKDSSAISRNYTYKIYSPVGYKDVPEFKTICNPEEEKNMAKVLTSGKSVNDKELLNKGCHAEIIGTTREIKYNWVNTNGNLKAGKYKIALFANVEPGDFVEFVPTIMGVRIPEWAAWSASLNSSLVSYYPVNSPRIEGVGTVTTQLTHYYPFNESSGNATDYSGSTVTLNSHNTSVGYGTTGYYGKAYNITSGQYVEFNRSLFGPASPASDGFLLLNNTSFTVNMWINHTTAAVSGPNAENLISLAGTTNYYGFISVNETAGALNARIRRNGDDLTINSNSSTPLNDSKWHMITWVRDAPSSKMYLYQDGVLVASGTESNVAENAISINGDIGVGASTWTGVGATLSNVFKGVIDEVRIYNRSLTSAEIAILNAPGGDPTWLYDVGSNNYNFSLINGSFGSSNYITGKIGAGLSFNGTSLTRAYDNTGQLKNAFDGSIGASTSFWFKRHNSTLSEGTITGRTFSVFGHSMVLVQIVNSDDLAVSSYGGYASANGICETGADTVANNLNEDQWYHVAVVINQTGKFVWLNGSLIYNEGCFSTNVSNNVGNEFTLGAAYYNSAWNANSYFNGTLDELSYWNKSLNQTDVDNLYNENYGLNYWNIIHTTDTVSPEDGYFSPTNNVTVSCNASIIGSAFNVSNISVYTNITGTWALNQTADNSSDNTQHAIASFGLNSTAGETVLWGCDSCDSLDSCVLSTNRTFYIASNSPMPKVYYPASKVAANYTFNQSILLNYTIDKNGGADIASCWINYNFTNSSLACTNTTDFQAGSFNLSNQTNITLWVNNTVGQYNYTVAFWQYNLFEFNSTGNDTDFETEAINFTDLFNYSNGYYPKYVEFYYNGLWYNATNLTSINGLARWYKVLDIPLVSGSTIKQHYWLVTLDNFSNPGTNSVQYANQIKNETVNDTYLIPCNTSITNISMLNFTFKDEVSAAVLNATISAIYMYNLGTGTVSNSGTFANTSENSNYTICGAPSGTGYNYKANFSTLTYASTGYPSRTTAINYSNINSTNVYPQTLYLLSSSDGIYVTFQVVNTASQVQSGTDVRAYTDVGGVSTLVASATTDAAGTVTFWLNPNKLHTLTFNKSTCTLFSTAITPTQPTYTVTLSCTGGSNVYFRSPLEGLVWAYSPGVGITSPGYHWFNYSVRRTTSSINITAIKYNIINTGTGATIGTNESLVSAGNPYCTASRCNLSLYLNVANNDKLRGEYMVNLGSGYIILETDADWWTVEINQTTSNLKQFFRGLVNVTNGWYLSTEDGADIAKKLEFSRIVLFFLFAAVVLAFFSRTTGYDAVNPGWFILGLVGFILIGSLMNGIGGPGLFYYSDLIGSGSSFANFINNWWYPINALMLAIGVVIYHWRRLG